MSYQLATTIYYEGMNGKLISTVLIFIGRPFKEKEWKKLYFQRRSVRHKTNSTVEGWATQCFAYY